MEQDSSQMRWTESSLYNQYAPYFASSSVYMHSVVRLYADNQRRSDKNLHFMAEFTA